MAKREKLNNLIKLIKLIPVDIEKNILLYLKDELILNWEDVINKDSYKKFKNYMNNGMGVSFKSEKVIRKYYMNWIRSHKYKWLIKSRYL